MRQHPIGTGPFKFVEFEPNEDIKLARNPDYWKPDRPYFDAIEYTIIRDPATGVLAFTAGKFDVAGGLSPPMLNDIMSQLPDSICDEAPGTVNRHLIINRDKPPFNNPELRRAMSLSIDRQAFVDIVSQGKVRSAACCNDRPADYGGCCRTSWSNCQATPPMSRKIALKLARSWRNSATDRTIT